MKSLENCEQLTEATIKLFANYEGLHTGFGAIPSKFNSWLKKKYFFRNVKGLDEQGSPYGTEILPNIFMTSKKYFNFRRFLLSNLVDDPIFGDIIKRISESSGELTEFDTQMIFSGVHTLMTDFGLPASPGLLPQRDVSNLKKDMSLISSARHHHFIARTFINLLKPHLEMSDIKINRKSSSGIPLFCTGEQKAILARHAIYNADKLINAFLSNNMHDMLKLGSSGIYSTNIRRQTDAGYYDLNSNKTIIKKKRKYPDVEYALSNGKNGRLIDVKYDANEVFNVQGGFACCRSRFVYGFDFSLNLILGILSNPFLNSFKSFDAINWQGHEVLINQLKLLKSRRHIDFYPVAVDYGNFEVTQDPTLNEILLEEVFSQYLTESQVQFIRSVYGAGILINNYSSEDARHIFFERQGKGEELLGSLNSGNWMVAAFGKYQGPIMIFEIVCLVEMSYKYNISISTSYHMLANLDERAQLIIKQNLFLASNWKTLLDSNPLDKRIDKILNLFSDDNLIIYFTKEEQQLFYYSIEYLAKNQLRIFNIEIDSSNKYLGKHFDAKSLTFYMNLSRLLEKVTNQERPYTFKEFAAQGIRLAFNEYKLQNPYGDRMIDIIVKSYIKFYDFNIMAWDLDRDYLLNDNSMPDWMREIIIDPEKLAYKFELNFDELVKMNEIFSMFTVIRKDEILRKCPIISPKFAKLF